MGAGARGRSHVHREVIPPTGTQFVHNNLPSEGVCKVRRSTPLLYLYYNHVYVNGQPTVHNAI